LMNSDVTTDNIIKEESHMDVIDRDKLANVHLARPN
jgi:hypothetical protein